MTAATASATSEAVTRSLYAGYDYQHEVTVDVSYTITARPSFNVAVRRDGERWTVVDRETGVFGSGEDVSAAIRDFQRAVIEHFDVLQRQADLSDDLAAQLSYLRQRVL